MDEFHDGVIAHLYNYSYVRLSGEWYRLHELPELVDSDVEYALGIGENKLHNA